MPFNVTTTMLAVLPILPVAQSLLMIGMLLAASLAGLVSLILTPTAWKQAARIAWRQKWSLVLLGILGTTLFVSVNAVRSAWSASRPTSRADFSSTADWPARGGSARTGRLANSQGPTSGGIRWAAGQDYQFLASCAISGNTVYNVGTQGTRGRFFAWDLDNGEIRWTCAPPGYRSTYSSPVIAGDLLVCGEGIHDTLDARIVCLDLRTGREGDLLWEWRTNGHVECTPVVEDGRVYVNAGDDGTYCLLLDRDIPQGQRLAWHVPGSRHTDAETSLAVHAGKVYVGLGEGGQALCVLDAVTGQELARVPTRYPVFGEPSIAGDRMYVGTGNGTLVTSAAEPGGEVLCLDLKTLTVSWIHPTPDAVMGAVVPTKDGVVCACADGTILLLDEEGRARARWSAHTRLVTSPAVTDDGMYVVSCDGVLTGLSSRWLEPFWTMQIGRQGLYVSSPVVADGSVFVGTPENGFVRVGENLDTGAVKNPSSTRGSSWSDHSTLPPMGKLQWKLDLGDDAQVTLAAVSKQELLAIVDSTAHRHLVCFENRGADAPTERWRRPVGQVPLENAGVEITSDAVHLVNDNSGERALLALDRLTGVLRWSHALSPKNGEALSVNSDRIVVNDHAGRLTALTHDGRIDWQTDVGDVHDLKLSSGPILVVATVQPRILWALDLGTGKVLWSIPLSHPPIAAACIVGDQIVVPTAAGVELHSLVDGSVLNIVGEDRVRRPLLTGDVDVLGGTLYYLDIDRQPIALDVATGRPQARSPLAFAPKQWTLAANRLLIHDNARVYSLGLQGESQPEAWWSPVDGTAISGLIAISSGRVYGVMDGHVLVCLGEGRADE